MPIIKGATRFDALVDPTRIAGDRRLFTNVIPASTIGMKYDPKKYNLEVVHEPRVGYRCISLPDIVDVGKPNTLTEDDDSFDVNKFIRERKLAHSPAAKLKKKK
jgi:hypothetical protein